MPLDILDKIDTFGHFFVCFDDVHMIIHGFWWFQMISILFYIFFDVYSYALACNHLVSYEL